jgi:hypothetical protein
MFRLQQQVGIKFTGETVELKQWQIYYGDVLVGYLPQTQSAQIQALFHFPHDELTEDVLLEFAMVQSEKLGLSDCTVTPPEQFSRQFVAEAMEIKNQELEDDDDDI